MGLDEFIRKHKTQERAAKVLGVSQGTISNWNRGHITPNTAIFIEEKSNGEITRHDLLPNVFGNPVSSGNVATAG